MPNFIYTYDTTNLPDSVVKVFIREATVEEVEETIVEAADIYEELGMSTEIELPADFDFVLEDGTLVMIHIGGE